MRAQASGANVNMKVTAESRPMSPLLTSSSICGGPGLNFAPTLNTRPRQLRKDFPHLKLGRPAESSSACRNSDRGLSGRDSRETRTTLCTHKLLDETTDRDPHPNARPTDPQGPAGQRAAGARTTR